MTLDEQLAAMQPRFVDIWIIPGMMLWLSVSQKSMGRWPRRLLFSAGVYSLLRNYSNYKSAALGIAAIAKSSDPVGATKTATIDKIVALVDMPQSTIQE